VVPAITEEADEKVKKRAFAIKIGLNTGSLNGDMGSKTDSKTGWHIGFDYFRGKTIFFVVGFKYWKNATGEELMIPFPSQRIDVVDFHIQGFTTGLGLGGYVIKKENGTVSLSGKLNYLVSHAINGNLSSVGTTSVSDGAFQIELGGQVFYKFLFFELSYEFGLGEAVTSRTEKFKYNLLNVSVGVYF